jgi:beta-galactosidase
MMNNRLAGKEDKKGVRILRLVCFGTLIFIAAALPALAQSQRYVIDASTGRQGQPSVLAKMGGVSPTGERITVNSDYITDDGKPIIPITGEFHFSRYPRAYWEESIRKIKAGGINMIATYVFWNIHEEHEGKFDWNGNRDLRYFIQLCQSNHIRVVVRIGPFCHGEIRNGGIPDWILGKPVSIRSNDPGYLLYVQRLYNEIGKQLQGLYFKDGGPIVAVQLENEMQHSASPWGLTYPGQPYALTVADRDLASAHEGVSVASSRNAYAEEGNEHMRKLKALALAAGIDVPIYTATGWGYAAGIPEETLPVTAAYAYPTWVDHKAISPFYIYKDMHKNPDYAPVRYKSEDYPAFAAELGSGIMSTYSRRPLVPAASLDALINRCLGSGANGIGYYMYHGGSTPKGDFYFNDEAYGYPKISYDFQAPIGEYGDIRPSFHRLKLLHFFINEFADILAPMQTILPDNNSSVSPTDIHDLRYAVREKDGAGFLFLNNFQDDTTMMDQKSIQVTIKTSIGEIRIPETGGFDLPGGENAIFPFHFDLNGAMLNYATAQLLTKGGGSSNPYYVFFVPEGVKPEFSFAKGVRVDNVLNSSIDRKGQRVLVSCSSRGISGFSVAGAHGPRTKVLVISKEEALRAYLANIDGTRHLVFSDALVLETDKSLQFYRDSSSHFIFSVYPSLMETPKVDHGNLIAVKENALVSTYSVDLPASKIDIVTQLDDKAHLSVVLPMALPDDVNDAFLSIDYLGDTGMGFLGGELVTDEFYKGIPWRIGLKRFIFAEGTTDPMGLSRTNGIGALRTPSMVDSTSRQMLFSFRPIYKNAPFLVDLDASSLPDFSKNPKVVSIKNFTVVPEYEATVTFQK